MRHAGYIEITDPAQIKTIGRYGLFVERFGPDSEYTVFVLVTGKALLRGQFRWLELVRKDTVARPPRQRYETAEHYMAREERAGQENVRLARETGIRLMTLLMADEGVQGVGYST